MYGFRKLKKHYKNIFNGKLNFLAFFIHKNNFGIIDVVWKLTNVVLNHVIDHVIGRNYKLHGPQLQLQLQLHAPKKLQLQLQLHGHL